MTRLASEAHRHSRIDRLDRPERARRRRRAPRPAAGRRPRGRRERRAARRADRALPAGVVAMASGRGARSADSRSGIEARSVAGAGRDGLVAVASHPDVDLVLCASSGTDGARGGAGGDRAREDDRAREQGNPRDGRRHRHRSGAAARGRDPAGRQRAQRHSSVPPWPRRGRGEADRADGVRRPVSRPRRGGARRCHRRRRAEASDVADGPEDHDRLGDADEQGARGDRGALAVRPRSAIRSTSSSTRSRSCIRWWSSSTDRSSRSSASPTCGCRFSTPSRTRSAGRRRCRRSTWRASDVSSSSRPDTEAFPCLRLAYRALEAARSLPVVLNAANEVAVAQFPARAGCRSPAIATLIEQAMDAHQPARGRRHLPKCAASTRWAREYSLELARELQSEVGHLKSEV